MNKEQITSKLQELPIEELSFSSRFVIRNRHLISGFAFIAGFFNMLVQGVNTVENWAGQIYLLTGHAVSAQALQGKLQFRHKKFASLILGVVLRKQILEDKLVKLSSQLLTPFGRVFLEDSTCVTLPKSLFDFFPGTVNQTGASSSARIQLRLELKSGDYSYIDLQSYRDNDQKFSSHIFSVLRAGDLVIRDLGYWALWVFNGIIQRKAFFLSRYFYGTNVYDPQTGKQFDLFGKLRSLRRQGQSVLDIHLLVGKKDQVPMRLVAIKVPPPIEQKRKRKMRKDKLAKRSDDYLEMLAWSIYVTNVEDQIWTPDQILEVYGYRWRIEIIFKCWKSKFDLAKLFDKKQTLCPARVYITFYLLLAWLTLFFVRWYNFFLYHVFQAKGKILSLFKFADFMKTHALKLEASQDPMEFIIYLARYCSQNKRKNKSSLELIYMLKLS